MLVEFCSIFLSSVLEGTSRNVLDFLWIRMFPSQILEDLLLWIASILNVSFCIKRDTNI